MKILRLFVIIFFLSVKVQAIDNVMPGQYGDQYPNQGQYNNQGQYPNMYAPQPVLPSPQDMSCPFLKDDQSNVRSLLQQAMGELQKLSGKESQCAQITAQASDLTAALREALNREYGDNMTSSPQVSCRNFQTRLKDDLDRRMEIASVSLNDASDGVYTSCGSAQSTEEFQQCSSKIFAGQFSKFSAGCKYEETANHDLKKDNYMRDQIYNISQMTTRLIQSSDSCSSPSVGKGLLKTGISTLTALRSLSMSAGGGLALVASVNIFSALADSLLSKSSARELMKDISKEYDWDNLNCLYYNLQRTTLRCDEKAQSHSLQCPKPSTAGFAGVEKIYAQFQDIEKAKANNHQQVLDLLREPLLHPKTGQTVPTSSLLAEVSAHQKNKGSLDSLKSADKIDKFLKAYSHLDQALQNAKKTGKTDAVTAAQQDIDKLFVSESISVLPALQSYYADINASGQYQQAMTAVEIQALQNQSMGAMTERISAATLQPGSVRKLDVALNSVVTSFQDPFSDRLEQLYQTYEKNKGLQTHEESVSDLFNLYQMCSLNAGMFYFDRPSDVTTDKTRNNINAKANRSYQKACSMFRCVDGESLLPQFELKPNGQPASEQFRNYQCGLITVYPAKIEKLKKIKTLSTGGSCRN